MKKFIVLVVLFCAVMISSTTSAATMANWVFVNDFTVTIPYVPKCTRTPDQYFDDEYMALIGEGKSANDAKRIAGNRARRYADDYEREQRKLQLPNTYKLWSYYIDTNSIEHDEPSSLVDILENVLVFHVQVRRIFTASGREAMGYYFQQNGAPVPAGLENLSFMIEEIHFKSPDGITKYYATSDCVAFTSDGTQIKELTMSNAQLNWTFIKPGSNFDAIFDATYKFLR